MALEVFVRTIKDKYMGAMILAVILFLYIFWIGSFFPTVKPMMDSYNEMLSNPTMKAFLGDLADLTTFSGFITAEVFSYMGIVLGAYVAFLTASFAAGEIEQKSSELMLSLPVSRVHVLLSRFATLLPIIVVLMVAMLLGIVAGAGYVGESIDVTRFAYGMLFTAVFLLAVGGGSMLLSALMSNGRNAAFAWHRRPARHVPRGEHRLHGHQHRLGPPAVAVPLREGLGLHRRPVRRDRLGEPGHPAGRGRRVPGAGRDRLPAPGHQRDLNVRAQAFFLFFTPGYFFINLLNPLTSADYPVSRTKVLYIT